ncbi:Holliday junction resolvase [Candidatus Woesearchaeota archaeon]|nr:MAG: Holliday junction resolvase [Candidatus Woesearchaeota archaeon]
MKHNAYKHPFLNKTMSRKSIGITAERDLVHKFNAVGWVSARIAGSGSSKYPSPDVIAGNNLKRMVIECKTTRGSAKYFTQKEVDELVLFGKTFGAEPWVAIKFKGHHWLFVGIEDLKLTEKSYMISFEDATLKGFSFEEIVK